MAPAWMPVLPSQDFCLGIESDDNARIARISRHDAFVHVIGSLIFLAYVRAERQSVFLGYYAALTSDTVMFVDPCRYSLKIAIDGPMSA